jgi:PAS domain S-box-containing protein
VTAHGEEDFVEQAKVSPPHGHVMKPVEEPQLRAEVEIALHKHNNEALLRKCEAQLSVILLSMGEGVISSDTKGKIVSLNKVAAELTGWTEAEALGRPLEDVYHIVDRKTRERRKNPVHRVLETDETLGPSNDSLLISRNGTERDLVESIMPARDDRGNILVVVVIFRDVTERTRAEEQIKASLKEKDILLREIHHRVKNNLGLISALLNLQSTYATDELHRKMFEDAEARVTTMALAHEQLYQSDSLADINFHVYVTGLVDHLVGSIGLGNPIKLKKEMEDISFSAETAIPLGIVITELVSNSLKHAFPGGRKGEVRIAIRSTGAEEFELVVCDNGIGMPENLDLENSESLGWDLVKAFANKIRGKIEIRRREGTEVRLKFREIRKG